VGTSTIAPSAPQSGRATDPANGRRPHRPVSSPIHSLGVRERMLTRCHSTYASTHPQAPVAFTLTTTALPRKYTFLGDLPLTALPFAWRIIEALSFPARIADPNDGTRALLANSWHRYRMTRDAFAQHPSQYTWDRHLYMIVSRYVWFNDLKRIPRAAAESLAQQ
jgi:N-acetylglucosaminylphosphatidylinositol deacetylase